jgi:bifunctional isochorismate lyase / aryl carrier protein
MAKRASRYVTESTLERSSSHWLRTIRAQVAPRPHLRLVPQRSALVVVDMLRYFASPEGRSFLPAAAAIVPNLVQLIAAWRRLAVPVFFTRHCHEGAHDLGMLGRFFSDYIRCGEAESEMLPALAPRADDVVVRKTTYDSFLGTDLEAALRQRGVEQTLVTGVLTHLCCDTTARSAFCRGFEVYMPVDATASSNEELHLGALRGLADGVAVLMTTREVLALCPPAA